MASEAAICNMALSRIGNSQRIDSLEEASIQAEQCSLFYEASRDMVLRDFPWSFATAFANLAEVAVNPNPGFAHAYAVPTDCITVRGLVNGIFQEGAWPFICDIDRPNIPRIAYKIVGGSGTRLICTSISPATLEYTAKVTAPELFDPIFVSALAWKLAGQVAPALAKDAGVAQNCEQMYQMEIRTAVTAMLNESANDYRPESSFITGRY